MYLYIDSTLYRRCVDVNMNRELTLLNKAEGVKLGFLVYTYCFTFPEPTLWRCLRYPGERFAQYR